MEQKLLALRIIARASTIWSRYVRWPMRRKQRSIVTCGHLECVADIPRSEAFTDVLGTHWCARCQVRGLLINYGARHNWPLVDFHPYAIGNDEEVWRIVAMSGSQHMLDTAASALGLIEVET